MQEKKSVEVRASTMLVRHWKYNSNLDTVRLEDLQSHVFGLENPDHNDKFMVISDQRECWPLKFFELL